MTVWHERMTPFYYEIISNRSGPNLHDTDRRPTGTAAVLLCRYTSVLVVNISASTRRPPGFQPQGYGTSFTLPRAAKGMI